ncbi:MAG: MFS transporter [Spirochaetaceae bacterium]|nr:MFS transporter [Spirochaetaceae bacterium]
MRKAALPGTIFVGLSSFQALAMFRRGIFYTFLGVYLRGYLGLSVTETTLFETIPMLLNILFQTFVWGRLTDRLQLRRSLIVAGEILASLGHLLMWYFHSICAEPRASGWVIIGGLSVIEIFWSMSNIGWSALISDVYEPAERNAVQGKLASVGGAGRILGALAGGALYDGMGRAFAGWGYKEGGIFFVAAAAMLVSVVPLLFMPEGGVGFRAKAGGPAEASAPAAPATPATPAAPAPRAKGGDLRSFAIFLAAMLLINCGVNSLGAFRAQYLDLADGFAATARQISLVANTESAALILAGFFLGRLGRRFGIPALLTAGTLCGIVSILGHALAPSLGFVYAAAALKGLSDGSIAASSYAFASVLIPPEKRGRYFAAYNAAFLLSWGLSATLVTGPLIDALIGAGRAPFFAYRAGLLSSVLIMLLGLALLAVLLLARGGRGGGIGGRGRRADPSPPGGGPSAIPIKTAATRRR